MTEEQVKKMLSETVWDHFSRWAAKETCVIAKGRVEYFDQDLDKYLEQLFRPHPEHAAAPALLPTMIKRKVEFALAAPYAHAVTVAGNFNDWCSVHTPLQKGDDGIWRTKILLSPGRHEYRFVVDGQWCSDPQAKESVVNPHGGTNSVIAV